MLKKLSALPILACIVLLEPVNAIAQQTPATPQPPQGYWPGPWHMWSDGYVWQFWWIAPLMMMLFMVVVFSAIFLFTRRCIQGSHYWGLPGPHPGHSALQILSERFARGEIQKSEYEEKKSAILSR